MAGSYNVKTEHRDEESEFHRLEAQALVSWKKEARLLEWLGLKDGMSILELGSGPGFVTQQLLSLAPHGRITAVDVDPEMQRQARARLPEIENGRLVSIQASATNTGLPDNSFDFDIARLLFQHLQDPVEAAKETLRVLKPRGKLAVIEIDAALWGIVEPQSPGLLPVFEKVARSPGRRGGNRLIGRRLWRILEAAGFENLRLEAFVYHSDEIGIEAFKPQLDPDRLLPQVTEGCISLLEFASVQAAYNHFLSSPDPYILMLGLIGCGEKA